MSWAIDVAWAADEEGGSGTTTTFTYGSAVASGALLVCFVGGRPSTVATITVSDSVNGAWTQFGQGSPLVTAAQDWIWAAFYFPNSAAGTPLITATYGATANTRTILAGSYTGIATSSPFDVGAGQAQSDPGTSADAVSTTATGATAESNSLAISAVRSQTNTGITTGSGWTQRFDAVVGTNIAGHVQDRNIASPATVTGTWTIDNATGDTQSIVGVFKEPAGAPAESTGGAFPRWRSVRR
jgi:hypothetical protein